MLPRTPAERQRLAVGLVRLHGDERHLVASSDKNYIAITSEEKYAAATSFTIKPDGTISDIDYILSSIKIQLTELSPANKVVSVSNLCYTIQNSNLLRDNTIDTIHDAVVQLDKNIQNAVINSQNQKSFITEFTRKFRESFSLILKSFGYASSDDSIINCVKVFCAHSGDIGSVEQSIQIFSTYIAGEARLAISPDITDSDILHIIADNKSVLEAILSRVAIYSNSAAAVSSGRKPDFLFPIRSHYNENRGGKNE